MGELTLFSQAAKFIVLGSLLFSTHLSAAFVEYQVRAEGKIPAFKVFVQQEPSGFNIRLRSFAVDSAGKITFKKIARAFEKDRLNPPLHWDKKRKPLRPIHPNSLMSWAHVENQKHRICVAHIDPKGLLTFTYYNEIAPKIFKLTVIKDPYLTEKKGSQKKLAYYHGEYVGRGKVTHADPSVTLDKERDIDFELKKYVRGFKFVKSLIICPEGRDYCTDGKRKESTHYFKKMGKNFFVEEGKATLFEKPKPRTLASNGYLQYAVWQDGVLRSYTFNYAPKHPSILEYATWHFSDRSGHYKYKKYIDAVLDKSVVGKFFKTKDDLQFQPKKP